MKPSTERVASPLLDLAGLVRLLDDVYPRFVGQIDRDPHSATFGSCDRGHWMYRLHDFDSGVLQQAPLTLALLERLGQTGFLADTHTLGPAEQVTWGPLGAAISRRTCEQLIRGRGFLDEYFPGERSFPGTVFSAYAILKAALLRSDAEVIEHPGLALTAQSLAHRPPGPASNQDVAAAAFLLLHAQATGRGAAAARAAAETLLRGTDQQRRFLEYGGADLGYATVSLNYLASMVDDGTWTAHEPLIELGSFVADFVSPTGRLGGEYGSRSTAYGLPFGMVVAASLEPDLDALARFDPTETLRKVDDRYLMHYMLPSLARSVQWLADNSAPSNIHGGRRQGLGDHSDRGLIRWQGGDTFLVVGVHKGGVLHLERARVVICDPGYRIETPRGVFASHELDPECRYELRTEGSSFELVVHARFLRYRALSASPAKTVALRLAAAHRFGMGPRLADAFRRRLIQDAEVLEGVTLRRRIRVDAAKSQLEIEDQVHGLGAAHRLTHAPPGSLRLVPSARFHQSGDADAFHRAGNAAAAHSIRELALAPEAP